MKAADLHQASEDDGNPEWTKEDFASARTFSALPSSLQAKLSTRGPQKAPVKERVTMRLSPEVVARFRASGPGWQTRIDSALKEWLEIHHRV